MHELIKVPREELLNLTQKLFEDKKFCKEYVEKNYKYILEVHSEEAVCKQHLENLKPFLEKLYHL